MATQKKKPGRVARLNPRLQKLIEAERRAKESVSATLLRLLSASGGAEKKFVLPSDLFTSASEARGEAVVRSVKKRTKIERPVAVRELT